MSSSSKACLLQTTFGSFPTTSHFHFFPGNLTEQILYLQKNRFLLSGNNSTTAGEILVFSRALKGKVIKMT
ncbi:hypothetical protein SDJN02_26205, partial [Cucurbita argyrosperma subsp. argyrosperma]